jgi:hypothetical protein
LYELAFFLGWASLLGGLGAVSPFWNDFCFGMIPRCFYDGVGLLLILWIVAMALGMEEGRHEAICTVFEISLSERVCICADDSIYLSTLITCTLSQKPGRQYHIARVLVGLVFRLILEHTSSSVLYCTLVNGTFDGYLQSME